MGYVVFADLWYYSRGVCVNKRGESDEIGGERPDEARP